MINTLRESAGEVTLREYRARYVSVLLICKIEDEFEIKAKRKRIDWDLEGHDRILKRKYHFHHEKYYLEVIKSF